MQVKKVGDKFVLHSSITNTDSEPMTRSEAVADILKWNEHKFWLQSIEAMLSFPHYFGDAGSNRASVHINEDGCKAYLAWIDGVLKEARKGDDLWYEIVKQKYEELRKTL